VDNYGAGEVSGFDVLVDFADLGEDRIAGLVGRGHSSIRGGGFEVYDIANNNITNAAFLGAVGLNWELAAFGDFNQDSMTDMMLRNSGTGAFEVYNISNNSIINASSLGAVGLNWRVAGFGNFRSLGEPDMLLRNASSGGSEVYDIANNQITNAAFVGTVGLDWQFSGVGNFSGNPGETDLLLRNMPASSMPTRHSRRC
jgi:hypothetical protein